MVVHEQQLVAYLTPADVDLGPVERHLRDRLPDAMVPTRWLLLDTLPLTASGKIDRAALPAPDSRRAAHTGAYVPPRNTREQVIADTIGQAIGVDKVGVHDDFFRIGGHSLAVMRVITTLRARHGIELTFRSFVEHRTVAGLAAPAGQDPPGAMMWIRHAGTRTPLFCVHPGGGSAHWYLRLAEHLDADQPVAAFEWPGPHDEPVGAEHMAQRYVAELRAAQPSGPYRLLSWCGGSGIATEMVRRLRADGDEVTFLLLDPVLDAYRRSDAWSELALIRRLEQLLDDVAANGGGPTDRTEILELLEHLVDDVDEDFGISLPAEGVGDVWPRAVRVWREVMEMDLDYRHRPYAGRLHLIASDELSAGEHEVASGQSFAQYRERWAELTGELVVHRVPGDHFSVMRPPHVTRLADVITTVLEGSSEA